MNSKQRIIVSITGIFIVLLALVYDDGNGIITGTNIMPGTTLNAKTLTVTYKETGID